MRGAVKLVGAQTKNSPAALPGSSRPIPWASGGAAESSCGQLHARASPGTIISSPRKLGKGILGPQIITRRFFRKIRKADDRLTLNFLPPLGNLLLTIILIRRTPANVVRRCLDALTCVGTRVA